MELHEWRGAVVEPIAPTGQHATTAREAGSPAPPEPAEWRRVALPGSPAEFAGADAVAYRTTFLDPHEETDDSTCANSTGHSRALVELEGVYAHAHVWHNGEYLGSHDTYFSPARFAFEPRVANELVVVCQRPVGRFGGALDTGLVAPEESVPSIRWSARVRTVPENFVADLSLRPHVSEDGSWIDATVTVDAAADLEDRVALSLSAEGFDGGSAMTQVGASVGAGERTTVAGRLRVRDPARWWPRGFGDQHRYTVTASLGASQRSATTGFVTYEYGEDGLVVNDAGVPVRGIEVLPPSVGSAPEDLLEYALAANASLIRPHAHVLPEAFYRACDDAGVLVWQPLPYCVGAFDVERGRAVARALSERCGCRPSLAAFGMLDAPEQFFRADSSTSERSNEFGRLASQRASGSTTTKPGTPRSGTPGSGTPNPDDPSSVRAGRADRGWRVRRALGDLTHGAAAAAVVGALPDDRPTLPAPGLPGSAARYPAWERPAADGERPATDGETDDAPGTSVSWVLDGRGYLADVPVLRRCELTRPHGNTGTSELDGSHDTLGTVIETLRRADSHVLTVLGLHDAPENSTDSTEPPGALAEAFEPVQAFLDASTGSTTGVTVCNDTTEGIRGHLDWAVGKRTGTIEIEVQPRARESVGEITVPETAERVELSLSYGDRTVTNHCRR